MKCRNMVNGNIVWFGSQGKNPDGTKIPTDNFLDKQAGVATSLEQRLSVIKGELWWNINYGIPLFDKVREKVVFDSWIIRVINQHPDVTNLVSFKSTIENHEYNFSFIVRTVYNENIEISSNFIL